MVDSERIWTSWPVAVVGFALGVTVATVGAGCALAHAAVSVTARELREWRGRARRGE